MTSDTSERGLERLICTVLTGHPCLPTEALAKVGDPPKPGMVADPPVAYGGEGWIGGNPNDYDREYCVDLAQLSAFLTETQPEVAEALALGEDGPTRRKFLARLQGEINKRGSIDVLRHGLKHGAHDLDFFYGTPSPGNEKAKTLYEANRFSVTRQLRYSRDETRLALDMGLFINGLPVATFELKNSLTKQTVEDAVWQYKKDRNPREKLFEFGRCVVHFAVDDHQVKFCTHLKGKASWFLPFNLGWNDGAGNLRRFIENAQKNSDEQNARIEHDKALVRVMTSVMKDDTELFKQFMDNEGFKRWVTDTVFGLTYRRQEA